MERSAIGGFVNADAAVPNCASLHPGYQLRAPYDSTSPVRSFNVSTVTRLISAAITR